MNEQTSQERRAYRRHRVRLEVQLDSGEGVTRDFSLAGLYLFTPKPLAVGERLELTVAVPDHEHSRAHWVRCRGSVVRVDHTDNGTVGAGVALSPESLGVLPTA